MTYTTRRLRSGAWASLAVVASLSLTACTASQPAEAIKMPTQAQDESITKLLPIGPHTVQITYQLASSPNASVVEVSGYIELPEAYDLHGKCSYDLRATETSPEGKVSVFRYVKAENEPAWRQMEKTESEVFSAEIGVWYAGDDIRGSAPLLIVPPLIAEDMGGGNYWCNLRRIDQIAILADNETGRIRWDHRSFGAVVAAGMDSWYRAWLRASEASDAEREETLSTLMASAPTYDGVLMQTEMELSVDGSVHTITGYNTVSNGERVVSIKMTFTPTEHQNIATIEGAKTYMEQLRESEDKDAFLAETR